MIRINNAKGFHLTFDNGLTISVQIGHGNYCDNYNLISDFYNLRVSQCDIQSKNAEVAIWDETGKWLTSNFIGDDDVIGYLDVNQIVDLINKVKNYSKEESDLNVRK